MAIKLSGYYQGSIDFPIKEGTSDTTQVDYAVYVEADYHNEEWHDINEEWYDITDICIESYTVQGDIDEEALYKAIINDANGLDPYDVEWN